MATNVSLDRLRQIMLENQREGQNLPARREQKIYVNRRGEIILGENLAPGSEDNLPEVPQNVFYSLEQRLERDRKTVERLFPENTWYQVVDGTPGWYYSFDNEFQERYMMFAYHDGSLYRVKVVSPEVEGKYSPHDGHLFPDGTICLRHPDGGATKLEEAYAKSVVWANGFTIFQLTQEFPFSLNNV